MEDEKEMGNEVDEHDKDTTIIVNGREKKVEAEELTYDQLIKLAFDDPPTGEFICFTITYRNAGGRQAGRHSRRGWALKDQGGHDHQCPAN